MDLAPFGNKIFIINAIILPYLGYCNMLGVILQAYIIRLYFTEKGLFASLQSPLCLTHSKPLFSQLQILNTWGCGGVRGCVCVFVRMCVRLRVV